MASIQTLPTIPVPKPRRTKIRNNNKPCISINAEMKRLEGNLGQKSLNVEPKERREHTPYTFNGLGPYRDMYTARFLVNLPAVYIKDHHIRQLAVGLCDPWTNLEMDRSLLPRIPNKAMLSVANKSTNPQLKSSSLPYERPPKEGSTRLPKFPVVDVKHQHLLSDKLVYSDVPKLRKDLRDVYEKAAEVKKASDYQRTVQDFYRMQLDRFDMIHPSNRDRVVMTFYAYLQNTPGSKKAIVECVEKTKDVKPKTKPNQTKSLNSTS